MTYNLRISVLYCLLAVMFLPVLKVEAQNSGDAVRYMNEISTHYTDIQKETWDYTSTMAHSRSAKKVERKRIDLLKTIYNSIKEVKKMPAFDNDYSLRDSVISYLTLSFDVLNNDFAKIVDMEEVAEQSYDLMEAYILAQQLASDKLDQASERLDNQYEAFASKNDVTLVESEDKLSIKLEKSIEAMNYYYEVYLVFFKAVKQEMYLYDAIDRMDINSIEQNRNALISVAEEGLSKLDTISHFHGDNSINASCKRMMTFFKDEAENKIPVIADFMLKTIEYNEMVKLFESKDRMLLTNDEVNRYNKAVDEYNRGVNKYNTTSNGLNSKRNNYINMWNNSVNSFMTRHIPKK